MLSLFNIIFSFVYTYIHTYIYIYIYTHPLGLSTILMINLNYNVYPLEFRVLGAEITAMVKLFKILIFSTADWFVRNESLCVIFRGLGLISNNQIRGNICCIHSEKMEYVLDYFFPILSLYLEKNRGKMFQFLIIS